MMIYKGIIIDVSGITIRYVSNNIYLLITT